MKLQELFTAVKEQNLNKDQLEHYHNQLGRLKAELRQELANLKKQKAMFMVSREQGESVASRQISWDASKEGQRKFEVEGYIGSISDYMGGIKVSLYNVY